MTQIFRNNWPLLLAVLLLVSCTATKPYQQPELNAPAQFMQQHQTDSTSIGDMELKQFFRDPALQRLLDSGIRYNYDYAIAINRIAISQRQLWGARALSLPQVNLGVNAQINRPSDNSLNGISAKSFLNKVHVETYQTLLTASWEVDVWGRIKAQKEVALNQYLQTVEGARAVQTGLVASIAQGYFNLLMYDKQLNIVKRNLALNDSFVVATRLLKDAGLANALAVQQAEAQRQTTALLIPQIEMAISQQQNALELLTGHFPGGNFITRGSIDELLFPEYISTGVPVALVSRRPDVRSNEWALRTATTEIGIAQKNMYPALNITVGGGLEAFKAGNWWNLPGSLFGLAAGSIAQPIFQRRALRTRYETAKLQREEAVLQFKESVLRAVTEVSDALVEIESLKAQEQIAAARVKTLQSAIFNAQQLFKSDMATYLEVITAQTNALQAELNLVTLQKDRWSAVIELYRALGGGWK
jgi:outer membrane protein, multidrug efflux system